jgi:hypothetical protein
MDADSAIYSGQVPKSIYGVFQIEHRALPGIFTNKNIASN